MSRTVAARRFGARAGMVVISVAVLQGCEQNANPAGEGRVYLVTVEGTGTGTGRITGSDGGGLGSIDCVITAGVTSGRCADEFSDGREHVFSTSTADPHILVGWAGCNTAPGFGLECRFSLTANKVITFRFEEIAAIEIEPASATLQPNQSLGASASVTDTDGEEIPDLGMDEVLAWRSDDEVVATLFPGGFFRSAVVTARAAGTASIIAEWGGIEGSLDLTVIDLAARAGADQVVDVGGVATLDGRGSIVPVPSTPTFTWSLISQAGPTGSTLTPTGTDGVATFDMDEPNVLEFELAVTANGATDRDTVEVRSTPPTITTVSPNLAAEGETVTITGTNFSPTPANNAVTFNGTAAVVSTASTTEIVTSVPTGATSGPLRVELASGDAVEEAFTVTAALPSIVFQGDDVVLPEVGWYGVEPDGSGLVPIANIPGGYPAVSPEGGRIAYLESLAIHVWDAATRTSTTVSSEIGAYQYPSWSPAGDSILFGSYELELVVAPADGSGPQVTITNTPTLRELEPHWGEIGGEPVVVFRAVSVSNGARRGIQILNRVTGVVDTLTNNFAPEQHPVLSPDGTRVAFARQDNATASFHLWLFDLATRIETQLTFGDGAHDYSPHWSPDGGWLVFETDRSNGGIAVVDVRTPNDPGSLVIDVIVDDGGTHRHPTWRE